MGNTVWLYTNPARIYILTMKSFIAFATLLAAACAAPQQVGLKTVVEGPQTGPLTALIGNLMQTPKGLRPIDLEGFSEDLDQDGFVDPVVPAVPAPLPAPISVPATIPIPAATVPATLPATLPAITRFAN